MTEEAAARSEGAAAFDLDEIDALVSEATPGPWHREMLQLPRNVLTLGIGAPSRPICIVDGVVESPVGLANVWAIIAMRNNWDALAAELRQARARIAAFEKSGEARVTEVYSGPSLAQLKEHFKDLASEDCEDEFIFEGRMNLFRDIVAAARRELP